MPRLVDEGRGWGYALALWLNANVAVQKVAVSSASFLKGTMLFIFISEFHLRKRNAKSWNIGSMDI
jgi:hypothetical protein